MTPESKHSTARRAGLLLALCLVTAAGVAAPADDDSVERNFADALSAIEANRLRTARSTLQGLVAANPNLLRARLELARVYYLSRDYAGARAEAERVLAEPNLPPSVRTTVLAFLAQIDADQRRFAARHQWTPSIYGGLVYDSNVNVGPNRDVIDIAGDSFVVNPDDRETDDFGLVINGGLAHTWNPGKTFAAGEQTGFFLWQSQANAYYRAYADENDFNLGVLTGRTGPAWVVPGRWRAGLGFQADQIWLGGDALALFGTINPNAAVQIGENTEIGVDGVFTRRSYQDDDNDGRDGWFRFGQLTVTHYLAGRRFAVQGGLGYAGFDADEEFFSYTGPEAFVGVLAEAWTNGTVFARAGYRRYDFDGTEPVFNVARDDDEYRAIAGFQHEFTGGALRGWALQGNWTFTTNDSNVPIYEFDRHQVNLGLARSF
jgi:hypothetical protein